MKISISVVVPVYNSEGTLDELVRRISDTLNVCTTQYEIILVNDASRDNSWAVIRRLAAANPHLLGCNLMHNYGQHSALLAGIRLAKNEVIVTLDDDMQTPPEEIPILLKELGKGFDLVYGKPSSRQHDTHRNFGSSMLLTALRSVLGVSMAEHISAFRAFRADVKRGFERFNEAGVSIDVLLSWSVNGVTSVPTAHVRRSVGKSGYNLRKLLRLTADIVTGYSTLPLRIANLTGLVTSLVGFGMCVFVVIRRLLQTDYVPGFAFLASEVAFFSGLVLLTLGVMGEYIARIHFRTMGKPTYVIRELCSQKSEEQSSSVSDGRITEQSTL